MVFWAGGACLTPVGCGEGGCWWGRPVPYIPLLSAASPCRKCSYTWGSRVSNIPEPRSGGGGQQGCAAEPTLAWVPSAKPALFLPQQPPPTWGKGLETSPGAIFWRDHPKNKMGTELLPSHTLGRDAVLAHRTTGSSVSCERYLPCAPVLGSDTAWPWEKSPLAKRSLKNLVQ